MLTVFSLKFAAKISKNVWLKHTLFMGVWFNVFMFIFLWNFGLISCKFANFINFFTEINLFFSAMALPLWGWPFLVWMFEFLNYLVFHSLEWKRGCVVVQVICPRTLHDVMMCWRGTLSDLTVRITCARGCVGSSPLGYSMVCHPGVTLVKSQVKGLEWPRVLSPIPHG